MIRSGASSAIRASSAGTHGDSGDPSTGSGLRSIRNTPRSRSCANSEALLSRVGSVCGRIARATDRNSESCVATSVK
ncbi:Uncharacterised protein [Mycobacteroides abscessus subsp. abscessus]|nr:Uncharacterised protein [Mycobacteroides abscessus subsp. abscessus]